MPPPTQFFLRLFLQKVGGFVRPQTHCLQLAAVAATLLICLRAMRKPDTMTTSRGKEGKENKEGKREIQLFRVKQIL
ncbi:hypothetical protein RB195_015534 [Necator americanus]|uniref:Secreted protein n=1 Tax=Necator americanus TaxID=51031 RepID=A0ABR1E511_NECAM